LLSIAMIVRRVWRPATTYGSRVTRNCAWLARRGQSCSLPRTGVRTRCRASTIGRRVWLVRRSPQGEGGRPAATYVRRPPACESHDLVV